jgi:hypothetical protein
MKITLAKFLAISSFDKKRLEIYDYSQQFKSAVQKRLLNMGIKAAVMLRL